MRLGVPPKVGVPLFDKLIHVARIDDINPGVDAFGLLAFGEVIQNIHALFTHGVWPLPDQGAAVPVLQELKLFGQRVEADNNELVRLDVSRPLSKRLDISFRRSKQGPSAREENSIQIRIAGQDVLDNLNPFCGVVVARKRRTGNLGVVA